MQAKVDAAQDDATKAKIKQEAQANVEKKMEEMNKQMANKNNGKLLNLLAMLKVYPLFFLKKLFFMVA